MQKYQNDFPTLTNPQKPLDKFDWAFNAEDTDPDILAEQQSVLAMGEEAAPEQRAMAEYVVKRDELRKGIRTQYKVGKISEAAANGNENAELTGWMDLLNLSRPDESLEESLQIHCGGRSAKEALKYFRENYKPHIGEGDKQREAFEKLDDKGRRKFIENLRKDDLYEEYTDFGSAYDVYMTAGAVQPTTKKRRREMKDEEYKKWSAEYLGNTKYQKFWRAIMDGGNRNARIALSLSMAQDDETRKAYIPTLQELPEDERFKIYQMAHGFNPEVNMWNLVKDDFIDSWAKDIPQFFKNGYEWLKTDALDLKQYIDREGGIDAIMSDEKKKDAFRNKFFVAEGGISLGFNRFVLPGANNKADGDKNLRDYSKRIYDMGGAMLETRRRFEEIQAATSRQYASQGYVMDGIIEGVSYGVQFGQFVAFTSLTGGAGSALRGAAATASVASKAQKLGSAASFLSNASYYGSHASKLVIPYFGAIMSVDAQDMAQKAGLTDEQSFLFGLGVGATNSVLERLQFGIRQKNPFLGEKIAELLGKRKEFVSAVMMKSLADGAKRRATVFGEEYLVENLQNVVQEIGLYLVADLTDTEYKEFADVADELLGQARDMIIPLLTATNIGAGSGFGKSLQTFATAGRLHGDAKALHDFNAALQTNEALSKLREADAPTLTPEMAVAYANAMTDAERSAVIAKAAPDFKSRPKIKRVLEDVKVDLAKAGESLVEAVKADILASDRQVPENVSPEEGLAETKLLEGGRPQADHAANRAYIGDFIKAYGLEGEAVYLENMADAAPEVIESARRSLRAQGKSEQYIEDFLFGGEGSDGFTHGGKIYIVGNKAITPQRTLEILKHETGHRGADSVRKTKEFQSFLNNLVADRGGINIVREALRQTKGAAYEGLNDTEVAEEYMCILAEKVAAKNELTEEERGAWGKVYDFFTELLSGIPKDKRRGELYVANIIRSLWERDFVQDAAEDFFAEEEDVSTEAPAPVTAAQERARKSFLGKLERRRIESLPPEQKALAEEKLQVREMLDSIPDENISDKLEAMESVDEELLSDADLEYAASNGAAWAGEALAKRIEQAQSEGSAHEGLLEVMKSGGFKLPTPKAIREDSKRRGLPLSGYLFGEINDLYNSLDFARQQKYFSKNYSDLDDTASILTAEHGFNFEGSADFLAAFADALFNEANTRFSTANKDLVVLHDISGSKLLDAARLGGLAMPSLGVRRTSKGHDLTFGEISLIAPRGILEDKNAKTYKGDMWSPVFPASFFVATKGEPERVISILKKRFEKAGVEFPQTRLASDFYENKLLSDILTSYDMRQLFEKETGEKPSEIYESKWLKDLEAELDVKGERVIFAGRTNMGRPKYLPETLENAVKLMKKDALRGNDSTFQGMNTVKSVLIKKLKPKDIAKNREGIQSDEAVEEAHKKLLDEYFELVTRMEKEGEFTKKYGNGNQFIILDYHNQNLLEAAKTSVEAINDEYYDGKLSDELKSDIKDFFERLAESPVRYFESKMRRAMGLNEFVGAVIPSTASEQVKGVLTDNDIPFREYADETDRKIITDEFTKELDGNSGNVRFSAKGKADGGIPPKTHGKLTLKLISRINEFISELKGRTLNDEERGIVQVVKGDKKFHHLRIDDLGNVIAFLKGSRDKSGANHIMLKHYGVDASMGYVSAEEILEIGDIIRGGNLEVVSENERRYSAEDPNYRGRKLTVVVKKSFKKKQPDFVFSFFSNKKAGEVLAQKRASGATHSGLSSPTISLQSENSPESQGEKAQFSVANSDMEKKRRLASMVLAKRIYREAGKEFNPATGEAPDFKITEEHREWAYMQDLGFLDEDVDWIVNRALAIAYRMTNSQKKIDESAMDGMVRKEERALQAARIIEICVADAMKQQQKALRLEGRLERAAKREQNMRLAAERGFNVDEMLIEGVEIDEAIMEGAEDGFRAESIDEQISAAVALVDKWALENDAGQPEYLRRLARTLQNALWAAAEEMPYGRDRESAMGRIDELQNLKTADGLKNAAVKLGRKMAEYYAKDAKRLEKEDEAEFMRKYSQALKEAKIRRKSKEKIAELKQKMRALKAEHRRKRLLAELDRRLKKYNTAPDKVHHTKLKIPALVKWFFGTGKRFVDLTLEDIAEKSKELSEKKFIFENDAAYNRLEILALSKFGGLKYADSARIAETLEFISEFSNDKKQAHLQKVLDFQADALADSEALAAGLQNRKHVAGESGSALKQSFTEGSSVLRHMLGNLFLNKGKDDEQQKQTAEVVDKFATEVSRASLEERNFTNADERWLHETGIEFYGSDGELSEELLSQRPEFKKYSLDGVVLAKANIIAHVAMLEQGNLQQAYRIMQNEAWDASEDSEESKPKIRESIGRDLWTRLELLDSMRAELSETDLAFLEAIKARFRDRFPMISNGAADYMGAPLRSEDISYFPVIRKGELEAKRPSGSASKIPGYFTPRVVSFKDIEEKSDIFSVFRKRSAEDAHFLAFKDLPLRMEAVVKAKPMQDAMRRHLTEIESSELLNFIDQSVNGKLNFSTSAESKLMGAISSITAFAGLGWNPTSALKQISGAVAFGLEVGSIQNIKDIMWAVATPNGRRAFVELFNSEEMRARRAGGINPGLEHAMREFSEGKYGNGLSAFKRFIAKTRSFAMTTGMDSIASSLGGAAIYMRFLEAHSVQHDGETARRLAMLDTMEIVERTQQSSLTHNQSSFLRNHGFIGRMVMQFKSNPQLFWSYEMSALRAWKNDMGNGAKLKKLVNILALNHFIIPAVFNGLGAALSILMGDDWDEEDWKLFAVGTFTDVLSGWWLGGIIKGIGGTIAGMSNRDLTSEVLPAAGLARVGNQVGLILRDFTTGDFGENFEKRFKNLGKSLFAPARIVIKTYDNATDEKEGVLW